MYDVVLASLKESLGSAYDVILASAKNIMSYGALNIVSFTIPSKTTSNHCNYVKIGLRTDGKYDVMFAKLSHSILEIVSIFEGVVSEQLPEIFEKEIGLHSYN